MGWRALRLALERDGLRKVQCRALLEAAAGRTLNIMFPMVSEPWEFDVAQALVEEQREWLRKQGKPMASQVKYGAMLEVRSEEHTSELQSLMRISYAVFCLKKTITIKQ